MKRLILSLISALCLNALGQSNVYYFAVTAYNVAGLESGYSSELVWTNSQHKPTVTLAWNQSTDPTVVGYNLYAGHVSRTYTRMFNCGDVVEFTVALKKSETNVVTFSHPLGLVKAGSLAGPWSACANPLVVTNVPNFFVRGVGSTNEVVFSTQALGGGFW